MTEEYEEAPKALDTVPTAGSRCFSAVVREDPGYKQNPQKYM